LKEELKNTEKKSIWKRLLLEPTSALLVMILSFVIIIPLFVSLYHIIPIIRLTWFDGFRIEHILLFLGLFIPTFFLIKKFSKMFVIISGIGLGLLSLSALFGGYGFKSLYYDYSSIVFTLNDQLYNYSFQEEENTFYNKEIILTAIDYRNEMVKNQANNWAIVNFEEFKYQFPSLKLLHCFSIFKEAKSRWNYVYDPNGTDYYSPTSTTLKQLAEDDKLKGDCDDYSILMAGLLTAVGGEVRLVRTEVKTETKTIGHLYPELKIGTKKDLEKIAYFIKNEMFLIESEDKAIFYYVDKDGTVWLNMDYNDYYPGGKYQSMVRIAVLEVK